MRSLRLVRIVGAASRRISLLRRSFGRRGLGYVLGITAVLRFARGTGMLAFESGAPGRGRV